MIIGVSASGRTPYVVGAIAYARARCAKTACITCNHGTPLAGAADIAIVADVGPRGDLGLDAHESSDRAEDDHQHDHHRRHDPSRLRVRNLMVNVHMHNFQAGRARHRHSHACLPHYARRGR